MNGKNLFILLQQKRTKNVKVKKKQKLINYIPSNHISPPCSMLELNQHLQITKRSVIDCALPMLTKRKTPKVRKIYRDNF